MQVHAQTRVGFQVRGLQVDPDDVSARLELVPSASHRRGDMVDGQPRTDGWCYFTSQAEIGRDAPFEDHATWMLQQLEPHVEMLASWIQRGWRVQLDVITVTSASNGGPTVVPELLRRLAALGIPTCWRTVFAGAVQGRR